MQEDSGPAIHAEELGRSFTVTTRKSGLLGALRSLVRPARESRTVINGVSFRVEPGELVGLLGPNGAGKSTLVKMLTGIVVPSSGAVHVNGRVPHAERGRLAQEIGVVFGQRTQLWWDLPARESLNILRDIYAISESDYRRRLREFDDVLALAEFWNTPVRHLSLGQRVRCDLAAALLHDPRIVFLDEPTIGMDVMVKEQVRDFLRYQATVRGRTVLLTTHDTADIAQLCDRLLLIDHGRVVFDGTLEALRAARDDGVTVRVAFAEPVGHLEIDGAVVVERTELRATLVPAPGVPHGRVVQQVVSRAPVTDLRVEESSVEALIRDVYRGGSPAVARAGA
ncbi:ABC transporter ATP-binding protein [Actinomadura roseirufa]|uniref:ABC transporter ATP-binding protein n=1 Tax=Actinomadura roseirufa TaxID=2094049 RepID=UPI001040FCB2|nr:ATP-binding cassette domain-containing protein [Actinomadura roseirufa]